MGFIWGIVLGAGIGLMLGRVWLGRRSQRTILGLLERIGLALGLEPLHQQQSNQPLQELDPAQVTTALTRRIKQRQANFQALEGCLKDWKVLAEGMPLGFLQVDENNVVIHCNRTAQSLLHIKHWQPHIKVLLEWVRSYELDQLVERTRQASWDPDDDFEGFQKLDWLFYPPGGEGQPVPLRGWAIPLTGGQVGLYLEDRLEATTLTQQRDRWASDVAHELKTPLTSIRLVAETLQSRVDPSVKKWVDRLLNETIRLSSLVQDLLELSSLNLRSTSTLQMKPIDLVPLIQEAWQSLEPQAKPRHQVLDYQGPKTAVMWGDERRLYRLFLNLLDNSIKYGKPDTPVHVRITAESTHLAIEVYDHGMGLSDNAFTAVFEPFFRTDTARARSEGGTGLGLAIVKQTVDAHHGTIQASNHPEAGGLWIQMSLNIPKS